MVHRFAVGFPARWLANRGWRCTIVNCLCQTSLFAQAAAKALNHRIVVKRRVRKALAVRLSDGSGLRAEEDD